MPLLRCHLHDLQVHLLMNANHRGKFRNCFGIRDLWRLNLPAEVWRGYLENPDSGGTLTNSCLPRDLAGRLQYLGVEGSTSQLKEQDVVSPAFTSLGKLF